MGYAPRPIPGRDWEDWDYGPDWRIDGRETYAVPDAASHHDECGPGFDPEPEALSPLVIGLSFGIPIGIVITLIYLGFAGA